MGNLADYNINEVAGSAALIISSVGGLLLICFKSRCISVRLLWGCYDCQRNVPEEDETKKKEGDDPKTPEVPLIPDTPRSPQLPVAQP